MTDNIKPIRTKTDYKTALSKIRKLWNAEPNTPAGDTFEALVALIEKYETKHYKFTKLSPVEAVKFKMKQYGLRQIDIASILGGKNRVSEILSGKKQLTLKMIKNLHNRFGMTYDSLIDSHADSTGAHRVLVDIPVKIGQSGPVREMIDTV